MNKQSRRAIPPFWLTALIYGFVLLLFSTPAAAQFSFPGKPDNASFYVDTASLLNAEDATKLDEISRALLIDEQIPLIVVTIPSLSTHGATSDQIESYAQAMFNHWGFGHKDRNYGMLLLVSRDDQKARIELGADWSSESSTDAEQVMQQRIIPEFRKENYSAGILSGVRGLEAMARKLELPKNPNLALPEGDTP